MQRECQSHEITKTKKTKTAMYDKPKAVAVNTRRPSTSRRVFSSMCAVTAVLGVHLGDLVFD